MRRYARVLAAVAGLVAVPAFGPAASASPFELSAEQLAALAPRLEMLRACPPEDEWRGLSGPEEACVTEPASSSAQVEED